jgi:DNA-binding transcriptional regulator YdaS (Cro superfamily)
MRMTLTQYFRTKPRGELTALADRLGTSKGYLSDIAKGSRRPSIEMARAIEKATGGQVPAIVLLGLARVA